MKTKAGIIGTTCVCLLITSSAQATVNNPEDFEGFSLTTAFPPPGTNGWNPIIVVDGWETFGENNLAQGREPNFFAIAEGSLSANTSQVLLVNSAVAESPGENMTARWFQSIPDSTAPTTLTTMEWYPVSNAFGSEHRVSMSRSDGANRSWAAEAYVHWFGNELTPPPGGAFFTVDDNDNFLFEDLPGMDNYASAADQWWVLDVEENNATNESRARAYLKGTTPNAWTSWLPHKSSVDFSGGTGFVDSFTNGVAEWDNFSMTAVGGLACDLNTSGNCDASDIDLMAAAIRDGTADSKFNVDGLGDPNMPDDADYAFLITDSTTFGTGLGDTDLNKLINFNDFVSLSNNFDQSGTGWAAGNFNTDENTNFNDFVALSNNFGLGFASGASVPEPAAGVLLAITALMLAQRCRKQ